jgi:hypothetical protein
MQKRKVTIEADIAEEVYAICDGDYQLQSHMKKDGYNIQQCTKNQQ